MSNLDLNNAADFATATMGNISGALQALLLGGRNPSQWDIREASYNGILIHVFQSHTDYGAGLPTVNDKGGRRKQRYMFPYRDGQTTDDLGRKPESFDMDILLFGQNYTKAMNKLFAEFNKPTPGILVHPVRGDLTVVVTDYEIVHTYEKRKAAEIKVTFEEHNFSIGDFRVAKDTSVKGALSSALAAFQLIQNAVLAVSGATKFVRSTIVGIQEALAEYNTGYSKLLSAMNTTFNTIGASDIPALLPVNQGGVMNANGTLNSSIVPTVTSPLQAAPATLSTQVAAALAVNDLQKQVNALRQSLTVLIDQLKSLDPLLFHQNIVDLRQTALLMQTVLESGIASSQARVVTYVNPILMTIREVAFANNIPLTRISDLIILNRDLPSYNFIPPGTSLQVFAAS